MYRAASRRSVAQRRGTTPKPFAWRAGVCSARGRWPEGLPVCARTNLGGATGVTLWELAQNDFQIANAGPEWSGRRCGSLRDTPGSARLYMEPKLVGMVPQVEPVGNRLPAVAGCRRQVTRWPVLPSTSELRRNLRRGEFPLRVGTGSCRSGPSSGDEYDLSLLGAPGGVA